MDAGSSSRLQGSGNKGRNRVCGTRVWDLEVRLHFCSEYSEGPDEAGSGSWVKGGNSLQQPFPKGRATINDADRK